MQLQQEEKQPYQDILARRAEEVRDLVFGLLVAAAKESWNIQTGRRSLIFMAIGKCRRRRKNQ